MNENIVKLEAKGFQDFCKYVRNLEEKNKQLEKTNRLLSDELAYFKEQCADMEETIHDMETTRKYLTAENAGKAFARELLGGA